MFEFVNGRRPPKTVTVIKKFPYRLTFFIRDSVSLANIRNPVIVEQNYHRECNENISCHPICFRNCYEMFCTSTTTGNYWDLCNKVRFYFGNSPCTPRNNSVYSATNTIPLENVAQIPEVIAPLWYVSTKSVLSTFNTTRWRTVRIQSMWTM